MEHQNKYFKELLKTYRGEYTQAPIDRISKSQSLINHILHTLDVETANRKPSSKKTAPISNDDVKRLIEVFRPAQLMTYVDGRQHSPQLVFTMRNMLKSFSANDVWNWLDNKMKYIKTELFYKQHHSSNVPAGLASADQSDELIWSELEQSFNDSLQF